MDRLKIDIQTSLASHSLENIPFRPSSPAPPTKDFEAGPTPLAAEKEVQDLIGLLSDEDMVGNTRETFYETLGRHLRRLLNEEKKSKTPNLKRLFELTALSDYNVLRENLRIQGCSTPNTTASEQIARCKAADPLESKPIHEGDWYARRPPVKTSHVARFGSLPVSGQGKGATHYSLLCDEEVRHKILAYLRSLQVGQVSKLKGWRQEGNSQNHRLVHCISGVR